MVLLASGIVDECLPVGAWLRQYYSPVWGGCGTAWLGCRGGFGTLLGFEESHSSLPPFLVAARLCGGWGWWVWWLIVG